MVSGEDRGSSFGIRQLRRRAEAAFRDAVWCGGHDRGQPSQVGGGLAWRLEMHGLGVASHFEIADTGGETAGATSSLVLNRPFPVRVADSVFREQFLPSRARLRILGRVFLRAGPSQGTVCDDLGAEGGKGSEAYPGWARDTRPKRPEAGGSWSVRALRVARQRTRCDSRRKVIEIMNLVACRVEFFSMVSSSW